MNRFDIILLAMKALSRDELERYAAAQNILITQLLGGKARVIPLEASIHEQVEQAGEVSTRVARRIAEIEREMN